ncbi:hypothetical protein KIPB_009778, partial [Kipferlia bialata]
AKAASSDALEEEVYRAAVRGTDYRKAALGVVMSIRRATKTRSKVDIAALIRQVQQYGKKR